jgi:cytochrome c oxidase subunit 2
VNVVLLANGGKPGMSVLDPASPATESIRELSILVLAITFAIFLIVEGVLIYCVVRFRRARAANAAQVAAAKEPPQVYGSKPIEIAWTAAPALIVFILVLVTTRTLWEVNTDPPEPRADDGALFVTVVGRQWWWEYSYDHHNGTELGFITANELHVPVGDNGKPRPVYLTLKSADVCHSFFVPRLAGKTDLIPGRVNHTWFQTAESGLYIGQCAEYCGSQHANMLLRVIAEPLEDFERWLANEQKPAVDDPGARKGKAVFFSQSCVNCHTVRFPGSTAKGRFGPDLTHLMSRQTLASGMIANTPENLRAWVRDPQKVKPGCLMPAFGLSNQDREQMIDYLLTLR